MNETIKWIIASIVLLVGVYGLYQGSYMLRKAMFNNVTHPFATIEGGGQDTTGPGFIVAISGIMASLAFSWISKRALA
jgi:hypothetical protein